MCVTKYCVLATIEALRAAKLPAINVADFSRQSPVPYPLVCTCVCERGNVHVCEIVGT